MDHRRFGGEHECWNENRQAAIKAQSGDLSIDRIPVTSNDIAKPTSELPATCRDGHGMTLGFALHPIGSVRRNWLK
jgi:hypothetical protein